MAFELISGNFSHPNEIIDALVKARDFDSSDLQSDYHWAEWGNSRITVKLAGSSVYSLSIQFNERDMQGSISLGPTGYYKIYRAKNALICDINNAGAIVITQGKSLENMESVKLAAIENNGGKTNDTAVCGGSGYSTFGSANILETADSVIQLIPYLHAFGGYAADNLYLTHMANSKVMNGRYYVGDDLFYIYHEIAIKDE